MSQKIAKQLRKEQKNNMRFAPVLNSVKNVGYHSYSGGVLDVASTLGVPEKMARRATRMVAKSLGKKLPGWAKKKLGQKGRVGLFNT